MTMPQKMQNETDLSAAEYLVKVELGRYPHITPEDYLAHAVRRGADPDRVKAFADEIRRGERPLDRLHNEPYPLDETTSLSEQDCVEDDGHKATHLHGGQTPCCGRHPDCFDDDEDSDRTCSPQDEVDRARVPRTRPPRRRSSRTAARESP